MNAVSQVLEDLVSAIPNSRHPILLFRQDGHELYWLGINEETSFRCNVYLVKNGDEALLIDPGGKPGFQQVYTAASEIVSPADIIGMVLCHQDPDVAASLPEWLSLNPDMQVISSPRTHVLLPHYGERRYNAFNIEQNPTFTFSSGAILRFIQSPFLHFPGAFVTLDITSGYLFSGDIWAALDIDWKLIVEDFEDHKTKMDLFNKDYMASNLAARGLIRALEAYDIRAILPQHGSLITHNLVRSAFDYLWNLRCGLDLVYADSDIQRLKQNTVIHRSSKLTDHEDHPGAGNSNSFTLSERDDPRNSGLREALAQAGRLARLRENALQDLQAAEERLSEKERQLSQAQAVAHVGHWDWDILNNRLSWSDEVYRIFGLQPDEFEVSYEDFLARIPLPDRHQVDDAVRRALESDQAYSIDHRIIVNDGDVRQVHEQAEITRDAQGRPVRMLGTISDITDRKNAEDQLQRKHNLIEAIQRLQEQFITQNDPFDMYSALLDDFVMLTGCAYGFIGEVLQDPEDRAYLVVYALTDLAWNEHTRGLYEKTRSKGFEFHDLENLLGLPISSGETVISNNPQNDPRARGLPKGHPPINSFLGIPVYFGQKLVGEIGLANRDQGFDQSIADYIAPLVSAYGQIIAARRDQLALVAAEQKLSKLAQLDSLLGIPNRRSFDEKIESQWRHAIRVNLPVSIIMIDIDFFKQYNDHYGHLAGDQCLIRVANVIQNSLQRSVDSVSRFGGEEFVCILPETPLEGAVDVARNIQLILRREAVPHAV
jgi:diguanylate cyclase (GGDEF)-like protein/PAS domain S-box-containing protein